MHADAWSGPPLADISCPGNAQPSRIDVNHPIVVMVESGSGSCSYRANGKRERVSFRPGMAEIYSPGCSLEAYTRAGGMKGCALDASALSVPLTSRLGIDDAQLTSILTCMRIESALGSPNGKLFAQSLAASLAQLLRTRYSTQPAPSGSREELSAPRLRAVREFIRENLSAQLTLEEIAAVARLSPSQVVRSFRAAFGVSPHRYVTGQRVAEAQRLLQTSRHSVTDIAMSLGFASPSHFSETFRRHTGVTPSVFRAARIE
jgi:AraC family transcriptional regulator